MKLRNSLVIASSYTTIGFLGLYISLYQFTLLSITQQFQLNSTMMGLFMAIHYVALSLPPLFLGLLSVKIGKKKVLLLSYGLIIAGTMLVGVLSNLYCFMIAIFVIGAGFSVLEATHSAALADEFPEESQKHINFSQVCFSVGALASPFIAEYLIRSGVFFKDLYIYISILFLLAGFAFLFVKFRKDKGEQQKEGSAFSALGYLKKRTFLFLAIAIFLYVGIENIIASFADSYYEKTLSQPQLSAVALSLFWASMIPSRLLAGILKTDTKKMLMVSGVLVILSSLGAMLITDHTVKLILFALCGFGCGPIWPFIMDTTARRFKGATAPALNIMMCFSGLGGAALSLLSGVMVTHSNVKVAYYFAAAMTILMIVFYLGSLRKDRQIQ